jgi:hypothetical protein
MAEDIVLLSQVKYLYNATAKQLYNLTLLAIGDPLSAERITMRLSQMHFRLLMINQT